MFLKKSILMVTSIGLCSLTTVAFADLITVNHTSEYSAAKVTSSGYCSGKMGDKGITKPGKTLQTTTADVRTLCANHAPCVANIIMTNSYNNALNCQGHTIAKATIKDLNTDVVTINPGDIYDTSYSIVASNNTVTITK